MTHEWQRRGYGAWLLAEKPDKYVVDQLLDIFNILSKQPINYLEISTVANKVEPRKEKLHLFQFGCTEYHSNENGLKNMSFYLVRYLDYCRIWDTYFFIHKILKIDEGVDKKKSNFQSGGL